MSQEICWRELISTDVEASRTFYNKLLGWKGGEMEMTGFKYPLMSTDKGPVGGLFTPTRPGDPKRPEWLLYVEVSDVSGIVKKAVEAGAKVIIDTVSLGPGTMAILEDPLGALFALWKPSKDDQPPASNPWGNTLFGCPLAKTDDAWKFYSAVFDKWHRTVMSVDMGALGKCETNSLSVKGAKKDESFGAIQCQPEGSRTAWLLTVNVPDADKTATLCKELGGKILIKPVDCPEGRFAKLSDNAGAEFCVFSKGESTAKMLGPVEGKEKDCCAIGACSETGACTKSAKTGCDASCKGCDCCNNTECKTKADDKADGKLVGSKKHKDSSDLAGESSKKTSKKENGSDATSPKKQKTH